MLNQSSLENQIKSALQDFLPPALEQGAKILIPGQSEIGNDLAKDFASAVTDMLADPLAQALAAAIDYYVKNISISGMIMTTGSPVAQQAIIQSPNPVVNGIVPNSLKIQ